jgi:hypothetical protein
MPGCSKCRYNKNGCAACRARVMTVQGSAAPHPRHARKMGNWGSGSCSSAPAVACSAVPAEPKVVSPPPNSRSRRPAFEGAANAWVTLIKKEKKGAARADKEEDVPGSTNRHTVSRAAEEDGKPGPSSDRQPGYYEPAHRSGDEGTVPGQAHRSGDEGTVPGQAQAQAKEEEKPGAEQEKPGAEQGGAASPATGSGASVEEQAQAKEEEKPGAEQGGAAGPATGSGASIEEQVCPPCPPEEEAGEGLELAKGANPLVRARKTVAARKRRESAGAHAAERALNLGLGAEAWVPPKLQKRGEVPLPYVGMTLEGHDKVLVYTKGYHEGISKYVSFHGTGGGSVVGVNRSDCVVGRCGLHPQVCSGGLSWGYRKGGLFTCTSVREHTCSVEGSRGKAGQHNYTAREMVGTILEMVQSEGRKCTTASVKNELQKYVFKDVTEVHTTSPVFCKSHVLLC